MVARYDLFEIIDFNITETNQFERTPADSAIS